MTQRNSYETPRKQVSQGGAKHGEALKGPHHPMFRPLGPNRSRQRENRMTLAVAVGLLILLAVPVQTPVKGETK